MGRQAVVISYPDRSGSEFKLLDKGHSRLIKKWHHLIRLTPEGQGCRYQDFLDIEARALSPLVTYFARLFYHHRPKRWQQLANHQNGK